MVAKTTFNVKQSYWIEWQRLYSEKSNPIGYYTIIRYSVEWTGLLKNAYAAGTDSAVEGGVMALEQLCRFPNGRALDNQTFA